MGAAACRWEALTKKIPSINASIELYKKKSPERELRIEAPDWVMLTKKIPSNKVAQAKAITKHRHSELRVRLHTIQNV